MRNPMDMTDRTVVLTGTGQGIGAATAALLHDLGANLVLIDMQAEAMAKVAEGFDKDRCLMMAGSVADRDFVETATTTAIDRFGQIDGLVNGAGITRTALIENMTVEQWRDVIDVNLTGVFNCVQAIGRRMVERGKAGDREPGVIVNISSDAGKKGTIGQINYGAAKSGVLGLTMSAAREWARYGVRVNTICYGVVETPMTETVRGEKFRDRYLANIPLGRFLTAEESAYSIAFLLSPAGTFITGQHLSVNGGSHITA